MMKRLLSIFYIYLFFLIPCFSYSMAFSTKFLPKNMNTLPQLISQTNIKDGKIVSPEFISICGQPIDCKNKTLEQVYKEIQDSDTNEEYTEFIGIIAPDTVPVDYLKAVNNAIFLSATTAWGPDLYAGKTPQQIIDYMKQKQRSIYNNDKMFSQNSDVAAIMPQMIQDKVKELRAADLKPSYDSSSKPTSSSVKVVSVSEQANEWTFVSKDMYEQMLQSGVITSSLRDGKNIGPQATRILNTSIKGIRLYTQYLQDLLSAVKPAVVDASNNLIISPTEIIVNKKSENIVGKNSKELYDLVMSEKGEKISLIKNLERNLQPDQVKQDFMALCAETDYCNLQKINIQKTINLFTPQAAKNTIVPISFGDAWFKKPIEFKGFSQDITTDSSSSEWQNAINKLKEYFKSTMGTTGTYSLIPIGEIHEIDDVSLYAQELAAIHVKAIQDKVTLIVEFMKKGNLYPAPMDAFNTAWNALYVSDGSVYKYKNPKGDLRPLQDPEDVDLVKQSLLDSFVAMPYIKDSKIEVGVASQAETSNATLPDDLAQAMSDYATQSKIKVNDTFIGKIIAGIQLPAGWKSGMTGLNTPLGFISNADIIKAVKSKSDQGDQAGAMSEHHYNILLKYKDELDPKDNSVATVALRAGKTYKEYRDILAGGASQEMIGVSKEGYDALLVKVQAEMSKKKTKPSFMSIKMTFTITQDYKNLKLPADYADVLFPALMQNLSYEAFLDSAEYKKYLEDDKATAAPTAAPTPAQVPVKAVQAIVSKPLVDQAKYEELLSKMTGMSLRPNFTVKSVRMSLGISDESGIANNEEQFGSDKDKLAQALFDKKTFDEYVALCGGKLTQTVPATADKAVPTPFTPPVQEKSSVPPVTPKPSTPAVEEKKNSNEQLINDDKIFDNFVKSIKISNILSIEIAKDQLVAGKKAA